MGKKGAPNRLAVTAAWGRWKLVWKTNFTGEPGFSEQLVAFFFPRLMSPRPWGITIRGKKTKRSCC